MSNILLQIPYEDVHYTEGNYVHYNLKGSLVINLFCVGGCLPTSCARVRILEAGLSSSKISPFAPMQNVMLLKRTVESCISFGEECI